LLVLGQRNQTGTGAKTQPLRIVFHFVDENEMFFANNYPLPYVSKVSRVFHSETKRFFAIFEKKA